MRSQEFHYCQQRSLLKGSPTLMSMQNRPLLSLHCSRRMGVVSIVFGLVLSIPSLVLMSKVGACNSMHMGFPITYFVDLFSIGIVKLCKGRGF